MNYESMLEQLDLTPLSQHRKLLKLITMYNIVNGTVYFPTGYFKSFPLLQFLTILDQLFLQTIYFHLLFHLLFLCGIAYQTMLKFSTFCF